MIERVSQRNLETFLVPKNPYYRLPHEIIWYSILHIRPTRQNICSIKAAACVRFEVVLWMTVTTSDWQDGQRMKVGSRPTGTRFKVLVCMTIVECCGCAGWECDTMGGYRGGCVGAAGYVWYTIWSTDCVPVVCDSSCTLNCGCSVYAGGSCSWLPPCMAKDSRPNRTEPNRTVSCQIVN